jgi:hypothetical protein
MKRAFAIILAIFSIPLMIAGEALASILVVVLFFGGILAIGVFVGHNISYLLATILAIGWGVLILRFRDRLEKWIG